MDSEPGEISKSPAFESAPMPHVEGVTQEYFRWGIGKIAADFEVRLAAQKRPIHTLEQEAATNSSLRYRLIPGKNRDGRVFAFNKTFDVLNQQPVLEKVDQGAQAGARGENEYLDLEAAEREYAETSVPINDEDLQKGLDNIAFQLSGVLVVQHDPELVKEAATNRSSNEALDLAEVSGKVDGYTFALEYLSPEHLTWAQTEANRRYANIKVL